MSGFAAYSWHLSLATRTSRNGRVVVGSRMWINNPTYFCGDLPISKITDLYRFFLMVSVWTYRVFCVVFVNTYVYIYNSFCPCMCRSHHHLNYQHVATDTPEGRREKELAFPVQLWRIFLRRRGPSSLHNWWWLSLIDSSSCSSKVNIFGCI